MSHVEENRVVLLIISFFNLYVGVDPSSGPLCSAVWYPVYFSDGYVQSTSKYFGASSENTK